MAPKGPQPDTGKKSKKKKEGFDWFEASINGGSLILGVLKEAAEFAPVPFLKQAAGTTLKIVSTVQVGFLIYVCEGTALMDSNPGSQREQGRFPALS